MPKKSFSLPLRVGIVGCGAISNAYFHGTKPYPDLVKIVACADIDVPRAKAKAAEHGVAKGCTVDELLADPEVDLVLNLTIPVAHGPVNLRALKAGKHAYCEKPFALTYKEGLKVLNEAKKRKLCVGCAPDTVLGPGTQTSRKLIDDGAIGTPVAATANMIGQGHEHWHPSPEFYYQPGGGPLFDMGPYYLTALVTMLGPVKSVSALAKTTFKERTIFSKPLYGKKIKVLTPTHLAGVLEFHNGTVATVTMSFDVFGGHQQPMLEVYGTEGSIQCTDPNGFGGDPCLRRRGDQVWAPATPVRPPAEDGRGLGLVDIALALRDNRPHRMNGDLGLHVLEVMESFHVSAKTGKRYLLKTKPRQPEAFGKGIQR